MVEGGNPSFVIACKLKTPNDLKKWNRKVFINLAFYKCKSWSKLSIRSWKKEKD